MAQILIRNLDPSTVERLKVQAERNQRSLEAEVRFILDDAAAEFRRSRERALAVADQIRRRAGPQTSDSVDLLREDRER